MKKLVKSIILVIFVVLMNFAMVLSSEAATKVYEVHSEAGDECRISVRIKPGDCIIIYCTDECSDEIESDNIEFFNILDNYDGYFFEDMPIQKKALQKANIRTGPGMQYDILYSLTTGDVVNAIGLFKGVDCDWDWYLLDDGTFVSAHLLEDA